MILSLSVEQTKHQDNEYMLFTIMKCVIIALNAGVVPSGHLIIT